MDVKQAVLAYLENIGKIPGDNEEQKLAFDYLGGGLIDSFGIIEMVTILEGELGIEFTPYDMRSEQFRTVGGLIDIAESLTAGNR